ncbi:MAG: TonB-dependent outer membrane protein SusC/RagA, conserved site [Gemmatimonadetes bacterium]|nr:TonB-dependent outer membrane protein SusC/RagA, conserved site [Gemmatimonadota bacterium]
MRTRGIPGSFGGLAALGCCVVLGSACSSGGSQTASAPAPRADSMSTAGAIGGGVTKADGDKLMENSPRTVTDMLVGRFAGVEVFKTANGGTSIKIRGARSMNANDEPLFVLDGHPQSNGSASLSDLDPHDIKSIEVLKGADASVWGSRGANGVILIMTKKST